jgi:sec-independent protein translocase protein TatA
MQLMIVLLIVLILFGAGKLPQVGKQLGGAINEFRSSMKEKDEKNEDVVPDDE